MDVSVVICTYNRYDVLRGAIDSILNQVVERCTFELIIVDNSTDLSARDKFMSMYNTDTYIQGFDHPLTYIQENTVGLSNARNVGWNNATGKIIAYLDDDACANVYWVESIYRAFKDGAGLRGVVGGPIYPIWPTSDGIRPDWLHPGLESYLSLLNYGPGPKVVGGGTPLYGTNIAYLRSLLVNINGFDTTLGRKGELLLSNEDVAVTKKAKTLGLHAYYEPAAWVNHRIPVDRLKPSWFRRRIMWQVISDLLSQPERGVDPFIENRAVFKYLGSLTQDDPTDFWGLFKESEEPDELMNQVNAFQSFIKLLAVTGQPYL